MRGGAQMTASWTYMSPELAVSLPILNALYCATSFAQQDSDHSACVHRDACSMTHLDRADYVGQHRSTDVLGYSVKFAGLQRPKRHCDAQAVSSSSQRRHPSDFLLPRAASA